MADRFYREPTDPQWAGERRAASHSMRAFALWQAERYIRLAARQLLIAGEDERAGEAYRFKDKVGARRRRVMKGPPQS